MERNERLWKAREGEAVPWDHPAGWPTLSTPENNDGLTWEQAVRVIRKHRWLLICVIVAITGVAGAAALSMRDVYQPVARLEIDPLGAGIRTLHEIENPAAQSDLDYLDTQVQILQSDGLAMRAIRALKLDQKAEFAGTKESATSPTAKPEVSRNDLDPQVENSYLREQLNLANPTEREAAAVRVFHRNLSVNPIRSSRLVEVSFSSHDPHLAQAVTNTLVSQYIDQSYRNRYVTTMEASEWLSAQLNDLREKVTESNQAVADYQKKYGLVESDERDIPFAQLMSEVSRQLSDAQADRIQAEAYVRTIDLGQPDTIPTVRTDPVYQSLLTRYGEVRAQLAQAEAIYGDESPNVKKLLGETNELASQVEVERSRLIGKVRASFAAAQSREQMMLASRDKLRAQMGDATTHLVEYRMLKNEALAKAALYNTLETRLKEAGIYAGLRSGNIHVVDMASNLHEPTSPHRKLILASGAGFGVLFALALVFVRESLDNTVRIPDDIRNSIQLPSLAVLPRVSRVLEIKQSDAGLNASLGQPLTQTSGSPYPQMFWSQTQTAEAEAIRALRNTLLTAGGPSGPQVVLVSSANAGEGKTTIALNLASVLAQQGKTCLLEGDLRRPMIGHSLGLVPQMGLVEVLSGKTSLADALVTAPEIPALSLLLVKSVPQNPADLMASEEMRALLVELRRTFEYIVIDSPPVILFSDASSLASLSDAVIIVSRYGRTTRRAVTRAAELLEEGQVRLVGVVLNDMDITSADYHYFNYGYSWKMSRSYDAYSKMPPTLPASNGSGESDPPRSRGAHA
jgi:succinoglycan biosynthesis transport protein ExoP